MRMSDDDDGFAGWVELKCAGLVGDYNDVIDYLIPTIEASFILCVGYLVLDRHSLELRLAAKQQNSLDAGIRFRKR